MDLSGIVKVGLSDTNALSHLADIGGESFLEEAWTQTLLSGIPSDDARKSEISRAIFACDLREAAPRGAVYCTPDEAALAIGYLASELGGAEWADVEDAAGACLAKEFLDSSEAEAYRVQCARMEAISQFRWHRPWIEANMPGSDFIHFACLAVDPDARGTGAFRRLVTPFLAYADVQGIPCFLETYTERLEQLYGHFGFKTAATHACAEFDVVERCMVRLPASK